MKKSIVKKWTNGSLVKKTSVSIGIVIIISMIVLVSISIAFSGSFLSNSINGEFMQIASKNGVIVQAIIDTATNSASSMQSYIESQFDEFDEIGYIGEPRESDLYEGIILQHMNKDIEEYILNTAWSTIANNTAISGIGVFFEPNAFDPGIKDYAIYIDENDAKTKTCQIYGKYEDYCSEVYYANPLKTQKVYFTEPFEYDGRMIVTAGYPIMYNNKLQGVIAIDINIDSFRKLESTNENYPTMFAHILTDNGTIIYDSVSDDYTGKKLSELIGEEHYKKIQNGLDKGTSFSVTTKRYGFTRVVRYYVPLSAGEQVWWVSSALNEMDLMSDNIKLVIIMIVLALFTVIAIIVTTGKLIRVYIKPINNVVDASQHLKNGDFKIEINSESDDEIGKLSDAFTNASNTLRDIIGDLQTVIKQMANNDFAINPNVNYPGDFKVIKESLLIMVSDLSKTLLKINNISNQVASNAKSIAQGAQQITDGATSQASSIEELQATITNVSEVVNKNVENAHTANVMAKDVGDEIIGTNISMQDVVKAMEMINDTSTQINFIINSINEIASQTNLLALNASIEAARAGEAGKGFAVVATQVGELATQSAEAAKNSTQLISDIIQAVEHGKNLVDTVANKLLGATSRTDELVVRIDEITIAFENQVDELNQILEAAEQIAAVVEENTAMAQESSANSEELAIQSAKLQELVEVFKLYQE